jgi:cytochrome c oxidase subunit II
VRFRRGIGCLTLVGGALVLSGCGSKQDSLRPESGPAHGIATLWWIMLAGSVLGLGVIAAILLGSWLRRDRIGGDRPAMAVILGLGIATPILVIAALFVYSDIFLIRGTSPPAANAATGDLTIRVTGHQFWWEVRYPGSRAVTANEIHIPVRTHVIVLVHSDDVIHSFWVPQLNRKIDLEPEQVNRVELYADRIGRYRGQCAEFCGLQHAHMGFYVYADPPQVFARWLRSTAKPATRTSALFVDKCGSCHTIRGTRASGTAGPDLTHLGSRRSLAALTLHNSPDNLRAWIRDPQRFKPGAQMPALRLTSAQVAKLAAYLEGLK